MATTGAAARVIATRQRHWQAIGVFAVVLTLWAAFGALLVVAPGQLDDLWHATRGLWLPIQALAWLVFLPWVLALWIWQASWPLALRLVLVSGLGIATIVIFYPRREDARVPRVEG